MPVHHGAGTQHIKSTWYDIWYDNEVALRRRLGKVIENMEAKAHDLPPLEFGDHVQVQNQKGTGARDRTGMVVGFNWAYDK